MPPTTHDAVANTKKANATQTDAVNNPDICQHPATSEMPGHLAAKTHAPYEDKPHVQQMNEQLTDASPTGYVPHDPDPTAHPHKAKK